jgi:hypothetical protein
MLKQALGTAVAAVFATAMAGAQAPAQGQQEQRDYQAGQMVTVEGCLQQDRDASAQVAEATRDDDKGFLLVNAQIQQEAGATAAATPREPATGTEIGTTGQAGAQTESPVGTSGAAGAAAMSASKFKVAGLDDERLEQYAGQRVRIEGRIEHSGHTGMTGADRSDADRPDADRSAADRPDTDRPTADPTATGTAGTTGAGESPAAGAASPDHSRAAAAGDMPKLKAVSIQPVAGSCPESPASR